jgi:bla regulator protein blaR1
MTSALVEHLLQSTIFAAVCALLTLTLRNNRAQVRYALWMAASLKFLVPFGALIALGRALGHRLLPATAGRQVAVVLEFVSQPISRTVGPAATRVPGLLERADLTTGSVIPMVLLAAWAIGSAALLARWLVQWWTLARLARRSAVMTEGREITILRRLEAARRARRPLAVLTSDASIEPGVFGLFSPRLLWPRRISAHLEDSQIEAILAHELSHVGRRDNLIAAAQMLVQAAFWFHPLVWWIGARLVDERERACDEDVLRRGSEPEVYAESILRTCRFSIESPLACVAGVTGADLKRRIETIMNHHGADRLGAAKTVVLAIAGAAAVAGPIAAGLVNAPRLRAQADVLRIGEQKFEVASVKPNKSGDLPTRIQLQPGGRITAENMSLRNLIRFAFQVQDFQLVGGPDWLEKERFDILAKAEHDIVPGPPGTTGPGQLMLRSLLADRFKLTIHQEKRELPVYALMLARADGRLGPQLKRSTTDCAAIIAAARGRGGPGPGPAANGVLQCGMRMSPGTMLGGGFPLSQLVTSLSQFVRRTVVDRTGLTGDFDLELRWTPDQMPSGTPPPGAPQPPPVDPNGPSIFTALQEQLGLKLESTKDAVDVLVIDHIEAPAPD